MKFKIYHTWHKDKAKEIEVNTIEELIEIVEKEQCGLIISRDFVHDEGKHEYELEIYDNCRE